MQGLGRSGAGGKKKGSVCQVQMSNRQERWSAGCKCRLVCAAVVLVSQDLEPDVIGTWVLACSAAGVAPF